MASILNKIKISWINSRIKSHQTKHDFNSNFLPIRTSYLESIKVKKLEILDLKYKNKLLPFELKAGIKSDFIQKEFEEAKQEVEDKYYWKERALKQTLIRKNSQDTEELKSLIVEKNNVLTILNDEFYIKEPLKADIEAYNTNEKSINEAYQSNVKQLEEKFTKKISAITTKINKSVEVHKNALKELKTSLLKIEVKGKKELIDEGIILKVDNLSMHFGGLKAVDELSFEVKEGEIFGLIGPNGAGKTTVFNCITRFYKPTDGDIYFNNSLNEVVHLNDVMVHNVIKEGVVRTFQNVEMIWELNIIDNLLVAAHTMYRSGFFGHLFNSRLLRQEEIVMRKKAEKILFDLELLQYAYQYPLGLPYGILKKIELARTLMVNPKLIILDEPAAGLNDAETIGLANTIKKIQKDYQATIFLVEHDMGLVMDICDTVCAISFGQKLAIGTPKEIQGSKVVQEAYLGGE
ncbi:ABC transporter ATP-binding protein [Mycoplasmatota bacterium WC30]